MFASTLAKGGNVKILVKTNFSVGGPERDSTFELDLPAPTLRSVLEHMSRQYQKGRALFNPETNEIDSEEFSVLLNGSSCQFLPRKLLTPLSEGDEVQLLRWFELLGGG